MKKTRNSRATNVHAPEAGRKQSKRLVVLVQTLGKRASKEDENERALMLLGQWGTYFANLGKKDSMLLLVFVCAWWLSKIF